jgi:hypothetical protein
MRPFILLAALVTAGAALVASATTPQKADLFELKLSNVMARGVGAEPTGYRTEFADDEVNAYLQLRLASRFPAGVTDPSVTLVGQGRLAGRAIVDLDGIRRKSTGGWFDPAAYLGGRLPVTAAGTLTTADGRGQLQLESAEVSGIPVPLSLLQELVTYYTKSPDFPNGVNLNEPFDLPSKIQRIDVDPGRAIVVQ